ncbi:MAG: ORF6N domain-containing protein [bacterium]|nr:ORF6N domain-containing protein [bacterium]MBU1917410.1 ORF6N domain-containing protein [bacterium]
MKKILAIEPIIYLLRNQKVMLSHDLACLYQVEPRVLVQAVKRNLDRFPDDFMFQLSNDEFRIFKSALTDSSWGGARRSRPYAFTEQGIAMLSTVLNSKRAIYVNIEIMRAFVRLRQMMTTHKGLVKKINSMEKKYDHQFRAVFDAIRQLMEPQKTKKKLIGFERK